MTKGKEIWHNVDSHTRRILHSEKRCAWELKNYFNDLSTIFPPLHDINVIKDIKFVETETVRLSYLNSYAIT